MMHGYDDGMMGWGGGLFGGLVALIVVALAVVGVIALVRDWRGVATTAGRRRAEEILDERFARGEIDSEEYARRRDQLRSDRASAR